MGVQFIYFDLGNVLLHFCHDRMCRQMARVANLPVDEVRRHVLSETLLRGYETGNLSPTIYHELFCREFQVSVPLANLLEASNDIFEINGDVIEIVDELRATGRRIGVLSNTNESHWRYVTDGRYAPHLPGAFEQVVLSFEERAMKPDRAIYEAAARRAGLSPAEIFFTDDREDNVVAARAAGFDAVVYKDSGQLRADLAKRRLIG